jgi:hypothetical protein
MPDRGVSTALGYVLGLIIVTVMITGLFITVGNVVEDQRETAIRSELRVLGNQIAGDITTVDRVALAKDNSTARLTRSLPENVAGTSYRIQLRYDGSPPAKIELVSEHPEVSVTVRVVTGTTLANSESSGGTLAVRHNGCIIGIGSGSVDDLPPCGVWASATGTVMTADGSGNLRIIRGDGGTADTLSSVSDVAGVGDVTLSLTEDARRDVPLVTTADDIVITNGTNETTTFATSSDIPGTIESEKTKLTTGRWNGSSPSVFFVNENHDTLYRVDDDGSPVAVATPPNGVQAVAGVTDIDDDGTDELVFADGSQQLRYLEPNGTTRNINGGQLGSNNGIGAGSVADFDGDGRTSVAGVDGSNIVTYVEPADEGQIKLSGTDAKKAPVTTADVDGDSDPEIIYVGNDNGRIKYVDDVADSPVIQFLNDGDGNQINGSDSSGVGS